MKRFSVSLRVLLLLLVPVYYGACATVQSGGWGQNPIQYESQTAMRQPPCTPSPAINNQPGVNISNGWTSVDPALSLPRCPNKSLTAFHCTKPGGCGELSWTGHFESAGDLKPRNFIIDVAAGGKGTACVMPARSYGVGIKCEEQPFEASGGDQRFVISGKALSAEVRDLALFVKAAAGTSILQIAQLEPR